jgi:uncharacterized membrane protein YedE/YeeE
MQIPVDWIYALLGGILIGLAVSLMLFLNGRVTGISGIINGTLQPVKGDTQWRWFFVGGLFLGGLTLRVLNPATLPAEFVSPPLATVIAGLLVGFGTIMGSGCTSGHGVCGISRLSPRSLVATLSFILAGMIAVFVFRKLGILP